MIIEEIQGNIANLSPEEKQKHIEKVFIINYNFNNYKYFFSISIEYRKKCGFHL